MQAQVQFNGLPQFSICSQNVSHLYLLELLLLRYGDVDTDGLLPRRIHLAGSKEKHVPQDLSDIRGRF